MNESKKIHNRRLNRYRDVNPYDHSRYEEEKLSCLKSALFLIYLHFIIIFRIILTKKGIDTDYINANLVISERAKRQYILCQGPLETTIGHFWLMGM